MAVNNIIALVLFFGSLFVGLAGVLNHSGWVLGGAALLFLVALACWFSDDGDDG